MASGTLKISSNYLNPYEEWRDRLTNNAFFDADIWRNIAKGKMDSTLDEYINALQKGEESITDINVFNSDYNIEYSDNETKLAALYNEVYGSRNNLVTMEREVKNPDGTTLYKDGKPVTEKYTVSEYDYYKSLIKDTNNFNYEKYLREQEEERKASMNGFVKVLADIGSVGLEVVSGFTSVVDGVTGFIGGIADGVDAAIKGEDFSDAFVEGMSDYDYRAFSDFQDWVVNFESNYTHLRDLDGNYTNVGRYLGGISYTVGQMLPSILITYATGGIGGAIGGTLGKAVSVGGSVASQATYYGSMAVNSTKEMYEAFASKGYSVTTEQILANAAVKTTLEIGVEKVLGKVLGGTGLDNALFGTATSAGANKTLVGAGVKRIFKDAGQEGLEEVLQETSGWLTDAIFTVWNENFSEISDVNFQSLIDSFVIGALVSFGSSSLSVIKSSSKSVAQDSAKTRFGRKIASYEYGINLRSFVESYNDFNESAPKKGIDDRYKHNISVAATKMYSSYRMIASMYGEIGEARFKKATEILDKIQSNLEVGKYDADATKKSVKEIYDSVFDKDTSMSSELSKKVEEALEKAGITKTGETVTEEDLENTNVVDQEGLRTELSKVMSKDKSIKKAVSTKDGNDIVISGDTILIPERLLKNAGPDVVVYSIAEHRIIQGLETGTRGIYKVSLDEVYKTFVKLTGRKDATVQDAIYSLVFDENLALYKTMLRTANKDMYKLLESLIQVLKEYDVKDVADTYYKNKVKRVASHMRNALIDYLIVQQNADYELDILTAADKKRIARERWSKNIYNKVILGTQLTADELVVLKNRIEYTNLDRRVKDTIYKNLTSSELSLRVSAMNAIDNYYNNIFTNKYDGKTYMPENTIANMSFNVYLHNTGLTLKNLLSEKSLTDEDISIINNDFGSISPNTILSYRKKQFLQSTYGRYVFNTDEKGNFTIVEQKTNKRVGFSKFAKQYDAIIKGEDLYIDKQYQGRTSITKSSKRNSLVKVLLNNDVPAETALMLSIDDVIKDSSLLSEDLIKDIVTHYNVVTPETTFMYLRELIPTLQEGISITVNPDGTYSFVNVKPMDNALKNKNVTITESTKIEDLVKSSHLKGRLEDLQIELVDDDSIVAEYVPYSLVDKNREIFKKAPKGTKTARVNYNTIRINRKIAEEGGSYLKFVFLHEFQHAVQFENKMNLGLDKNWLDNCPGTVQLEIIRDVKKHMPQLFNKNMTYEQQISTVSNFVYFSTAESMAYGLDASGFVDYYPTIVNLNKDNISVTLPWGTRYTISSNSTSKSSASRLSTNLYEALGIKRSTGIRDFMSVDSDEYLNISSQFFDFVEQYDISLFRELDSWMSRTVLSNSDKSRLYNILKSNELLKNKSIESLHKLLSPNLTLSEFLESDVPFIRIQNTDKLYNEDFVSTYAGATDKQSVTFLLNEITNLLSHNKTDKTLSMDNMYLFVGTFKPKDVLVYLPFDWSEALIEPSKIKNAKVYKLKVDNSDNVYSFDADWLVEDSNGNTVQLSDNSQRDVLGTYIPKMSAKNIEADTKRYVPQKEAKGTILEGWVSEGKKLQINPKLRKFLLSTQGKKLDYEIQKKIDDKTLTIDDLKDYIRNTDLDNMHVTTFQLINKALYDNKVITTPKKLKEFTRRTEQYYAIGKLFSKDDVMNELFLNDTDSDLGLERIKAISNLPNSNEIKQAYQGYLAEAISYKKFKPAYTDKKGVYHPAKMPIEAKDFDAAIRKREEGKGTSYDDTFVLDDKRLRLAWLENFDGSISSGLDIAELSRDVAKAKQTITKGVEKGTVSYNVKVGEDGDTELADMLSDDDSAESVINKVAEIAQKMDTDMMKDELRMSMSEAVGKVIAEKYGISSKNTILQYYKMLNEISDEQLTVEYCLLKFSELMGVDFEAFSKSEKLTSAVKSETKTPWQLVNAMRSNITSINNRLSPKQIDILLNDENAAQYFYKKNGKLALKDEVFKVPNVRKKGLFVYRKVDELLDIRDGVKSVLDKVKSGAYNSKDNFKQYNKHLENIEKQHVRLAKDLNKKTDKVVKPEKLKTVTVGSDELKFDATTFDTSKPIPDVLLKILGVEFDEQRKTKVKYFSKDNDYYTVTNLRKFMDTHTQLFLELTQNDIDQLVDYYVNAELLKLGISESQYRLYKAVEEWMGGFIIRWVEQGRFVVDSVLFEKLQEKMRFSASLAAQTLANRKATLNILNPEIELTMSAADLNGLHPSRESVEEMFTAIALGDAKRVKAAKQRMFDSMSANYKGPKRTFLDKLLQFQRIGMLSGPGTFIRNKVSNFTLEKLLDMSDFFGKIISRKAKKVENQYVMYGTKVSKEAYDFIQKNLIENGLINELREGLSKYDSRYGKDKTGAENLLYMITRSIRTEIFYNNQTGNKVLDSYYNLIYKALSDDNAITKQMIKYLGKMLTEDASKSSSPTTYFSNGINSKISNTIAEAYRLAAIDFMHKPNWISHMEGKLFNQVPRPVYFAYKQLFPFAAASYNWFTEALKYNPIGLLISIKNYAKLETTIETLEKKRRNGEPVVSSRFAQYIATRDIGKGIVGSIGTLIGVLLAVFGIVKLDEEDDKYKLTIPGTGTYLDITDVFGSQSIFLGMTLAGSTIDFFKDDEKGFAKFTDIFVNTLDSMVLDSTITDLYNTFRYSGSAADTLMEIPYKSLEMSIPNFIKTFASLSRRYNVKYSDGILGKIEKLGTNIVPFLDRQFAQVDVYTGEKQVPYRAQWIINVINKLGPIDIQPYKVSDTEKLAIELGLSKGMLTGKYKIDDKNVKLSISEIQELNRYYGKLNNSDLEELISNKTYYKVKDENGNYKNLRYKDMTDKQRKAAFEQVMSKNSSYAKIYILTSKGYKYYASTSEFNELRRLGISKNVYKKTANKNGFVK